MTLSKKKMLVNFINSYQKSMQKAKEMMQQGDLNNYMYEIIEAEKIMKIIKNIAVSENPNTEPC